MDIFRLNKWSISKYNNLETSGTTYREKLVNKRIFSVKFVLELKTFLQGHIKPKKNSVYKRTIPTE